MQPLLESLESRRMFAVVGIRWVNSAGSTLADNAAFADDSVVTARIQTVNMRGQSGNVFLFEDDSLPINARVRTIPFTVPSNSDTATVRVRLDWEDDGLLGGNPEFYLARTTNASEPIISRHVVVRRTNSSGAQTDANDTIAEAVSLGAMDNVRTTSGKISHGRDVDLFSFTVQAGQWVAFDVDAVDALGFNSTVRVFNSSGTQLALNDTGSVLTDTMSKESLRRDVEPLNLQSGTSAFAHVVFPQAGTFAVAVSGGGNFAYNASTGGSDVNGASGAYKLTVTPLTRDVSTGGTRTWSGELRLANPDTGSWRDTRIDVSLRREGDTPFSTSNFTWVLTHGRVDTRGSWGPIVASLDTYFSDDQIFTLDWSDGARDNDGGAGLQGSAWVPLVGQWAEALLARKGVPAPNTSLIGHSWGTYVSFEMAQRSENAGRGEVNSIVALDPAQDTPLAGVLGLQYEATAVNYRNHSRRAWAIFGDGLFGSASLSATADEAFKLEYVSGPGDLARHEAPRDVFRTLIENRDSTRLIFSNFRLERLRNNTAGPWRVNAYEDKFEGIFRADVTDAGGNYSFNELIHLRHHNGSNTEVTRTA